MASRRAHPRRHSPRIRVADENWIREHLEELVNKHAGKYAVVAAGEVFIGEDPAQLEAKARRKHPGIIPQGLPIPRPEDFTCAL